MTPTQEWTLPTRRLGRRVLVFDRVESTNDVAAALAEDGLAVLADEQTRGRGQYGRTWQAAPRSSVLLSVLLFPPPPLRRPALLTAWATVAVCTTVRELIGTSARIKWPNDVLLRERKVCGILLETADSPNGPQCVVGIGLNLSQTAADFAAGGLPQATSLGQFRSEPLDTHEVARHLLRRLDDDYHRLCRGDSATLEANWRHHLDLLGQLVRAECADGDRYGRLVGLSLEGVELERPGATRLRLQPEQVKHLDPVVPPS